MIRATDLTEAYAWVDTKATQLRLTQPVRDDAKYFARQKFGHDGTRLPKRVAREAISEAVRFHS